MHGTPAAVIDCGPAGAPQRRRRREPRDHRRRVGAQHHLQVPGRHGVVLLHLEPAELLGDRLGRVVAVAVADRRRLGVGRVVDRAADEAEAGEPLQHLPGEPVHPRPVAHVHDVVRRLDLQRRRGLRGRGGGGLLGAARGLLPGGAALLDEGAHLRRVDEHDAAPGVRLGATGRHGQELEVARRDAGGLPGEREQVPARVEDHRLLRDLHEPGQLRRVGQRPAGEDLVGDGGQEHLLAADPGEVALGQAVALAHERERVGTGDRERAGGEAGPGQRLVDGVLQADVDPADGLRQVVEAEQVDLGVVVDGDAGEPLHRPDQRGPAGLRGLRVDPGAVPDALADQALGGQRLHRRIRRVDLVLAVAGDVDVAVARDREGDGGPAALGDVQQDDRVGVQHARVVAAGVQLLQHLLRQRVALRVGAAVDPDEQDVLRPAAAAAHDHVGGDDAAGDVAVEAPGRAVQDEDQRGGGDGGQAQPPQQAARAGAGLGGGSGAGRRAAGSQGAGEAGRRCGGRRRAAAGAVVAARWPCSDPVAVRPPCCDPRPTSRRRSRPGARRRPGIAATNGGDGRPRPLLAARSPPLHASSPSPDSHPYRGAGARVADRHGRAARVAGVSRVTLVAQIETLRD